MCTAIKCESFVGRNLDVYKTYGEEIIITPREYCIALRKEENIKEHYAIIGMGTVARGYPLYYDAANEHGLYVAGLNYVGNAKYHSPKDKYINLAPYELMPYILGKCKNVAEAEIELSKINLTDIPFSRELPTAELHWIIADKERAITVEPDAKGLNIYDNLIGVLTNNPPFPCQLLNLSSYTHLSIEPLENTLAPKIDIPHYSEGMGAIGMPGDLSSASRFARALFHKSHTRCGDSITSFFHLLTSVEMPDGSVKVGDSYERTEYTSAVDLKELTYFYRHYDSATISAVRLKAENLDTPRLISYPISVTKPTYQN